ncbi:hypothetical protein ACHAXS_001255 [Conticribra weissflogii]
MPFVPWQRLVFLSVILAESNPSNAQCSICADGFDPSLANFEIPNSGGMTCGAVETGSALVPPDSAECEQMMGIQGFCCPKCYMCGSAEDDAKMSNPLAIILPDRPMSCIGMAHLYHMLSYPSAECPADPADLDTSMFPGVPGVAVGFELRGFCGCPGFEDSAPELPVCSLCPVGRIVSDSAVFAVGVAPNTTFTCQEGAAIADYVISEFACIIDAENEAACCADEEVATTTDATDSTKVESSETTPTVTDAETENDVPADESQGEDEVSESEETNGGLSTTPLSLFFVALCMFLY